MGQKLAQNPQITSEELAEYLVERWGGKFSPRRVREVLVLMGHKRNPTKPTLLTPKNMADRLNYAIHRRDTDWKRIWAYDQSYFNLTGSRPTVRSNKATSHRARRRRLTGAQEKVSICVSAAISYNSKSDICILPKNWRCDDFTRSLRNELLPSIGWDPTRRKFRAFLIDNDGRHHNADVRNVLREYKLDRNGFLPSNSPDLNPIENIWNIMKSYVRSKEPQNEQQLRQAIQEAWDSISPETLRKQFDSLPDRIEQVILNNGDKTRY